MKKVTLLLTLLLCLSVIVSNAQTTIWSEDFNDPADEGVGATGPIPVGTNTGVTAPSSGKWTVDVTNCNLSATSDWYRVENSLLEARDVDGTQQAGGTGDGALWTSESISITGYTNVTIYVDFAKSGTMEDADFIKASYQIDGGTITQFAFFNDDFTNQTVSVSGLSGSTLVIYLEADNGAGTEYHRFDNVIVEGIAAGGVANPTNFTAVTAGTGRIDLSWTQNGNDDDVMLAYTTDGIFGTPVDGTTYPAGDQIPDGGEVIFNGVGASFYHVGLSPDTRYYYMAWSVDGSANYSSGVSDDTTTLATEPTADATAFTATSNGTTAIDLSWTDADPAADNYLIKASDVDYASIVDPVDGTPEADGSLVLNVASGLGAATMSGLAPNTQYWFKIYPVNGDNGSVNFKVDSPDEATATTDAANTDLIISEVSDPGDHWDGRFVELHNISASIIDFSLDDWYLVKQTGQAGGGGSTSEIKLTVSIAAGGIYTVANNDANFNTYYGFSPNLVSSTVINGNGDDAYYLYYGGGYGVGTLIDVFGEDDDGTGKDWEYLDSKAVRLRSVTTPNTTWTASEWDIPGSADVDNMTPSSYREDVTWQGAGTNADDWNEKGGNWPGTYGYIPDASFNVTVPSTTASPVVYSEAACNDLIVNGGGSLDVSVNVGLTAYGDLDVTAGTFTIKSDGTGNGSVIVKGTATGSATVQRYLQGYVAGADNGWHLIGSPVDNMLISGSGFDPTGTSNDLYRWDEPSDTWENFKVGHADFTNFKNGKGYLIATENDETFDFTGTLNTSDVTVSNLTSDVSGWNILGNPFSSALVWDNGGWTFTGVSGTAQVWEESNNDYKVINPDEIIPSTNGFFVEVGTAPGSVTIPALARTHDMTNFYKKSRSGNYEETLDLVLTNDENSYYNLCRVGFKPDATEEWDIEFDAHKLFGGSGTSQLWSVVGEENFAQNYLPYVYDSYQLPIYFKAGTNATHHISARGIESFYDNSGIYLEDLFTNELIKLSEQQLYTFTATTDDDEARFILHFSMVTSIGDVPELVDNVSIYAHSNSIYIRFSEMPESDFRVEVFNAIGQQVFSDEMEASTLSTIKLYQKPGLYIVRLKTSNNFIVKKIILK